MYREPRLLCLAQRIVAWAWDAGSALVRPRTEPGSEYPRVLALIARQLEVSEFDIFGKAYRSWYGYAPAVRELEREFGRFLNQQCDLPFYVRRFIARIGTLAA